MPILTPPPSPPVASSVRSGLVGLSFFRGFRLFRLALPCLFFCLLFPSLCPARDADEKEVVAIGLGVSEDAARREAYRNAVQSVIGAMVVAETIVENDALVRDKVLSHSDGYVSKATQVGPARPAGDGLIEVTMRVTVKSGRLQEKLKDEHITVSALDGAVLFEKALRQMEERERAVQRLEGMLRALPASLMYAEADVAKAGRKISGQGLRLTLPVQVFIDLGAYERFAGQLQAWFEEQGFAKAQLNLSLDKDGGLYTQGLLKKAGGPKKGADGGELFLFALCEVVQTDKQVSRWSVYFIPRHIMDVFKRPSRLAVDVALLDQDGRPLAGGELYMGDKDYANLLLPSARVDGAIVALLAPRFNLYGKSLSLQSPLNRIPQSKEVTLLLTEEELRRVTDARCNVRNRE